MPETLSYQITLNCPIGADVRQPVEQLLRDARIITIYEGTTGMQGQDFLFRRLLKDGGKTLE